MGTPAVGNIPSCRIGASSWVDGSGNLWLFGGTGRDITGYWGDLNSLWEFNPTTKQWSWMGGGDLVGLPNGDLPGTYGTLGVPAAGNIPASRWAAATWTDATGNFWLLGGLQTGFESDTYIILLNELWEFNPASDEWAWMGGTQINRAAGVYGMLGTPSAGNMPGGREASASWQDRAGDFWLFGGSDNYSFGDLNDVWEYFPSAPAPVPGFALVDNTQGFSLPAGTSGTTTINSVVSGGFNGPISLSANNLPDGVTVSFNPSAIEGFSSTTETFSVAFDATPGDYTTTVSGTSGGVLESTTVLLTIASPPPSNFTLSAAPSSLTLSPGGQGTVALTVTPQYGFNSTLTFACSGLPDGVTCAFSPATVTPAGGAVTTQMTLSASSQALIAKPTWLNLLPHVVLGGVVCLVGWDQRRKWSRLLVIVLALTVIGMFCACGGGGSGSGGSSGNSNQTPTITAITVTASGAAMHSTTVTLTLN
jgi:hypothetical protein